MSFYVAVCPHCGVPWPTLSRMDVRLIEHVAFGSTPATIEGTFEGTGPFTPCTGSLLSMDLCDCGENEDPRFGGP